MMFKDRLYGLKSMLFCAGLFALSSTGHAQPAQAPTPASATPVEPLYRQLQALQSGNGQPNQGTPPQVKQWANRAAKRAGFMRAQYALLTRGTENEVSQETRRELARLRAVRRVQAMRDAAGLDWTELPADIEAELVAHARVVAELRRIMQISQGKLDAATMHRASALEHEELTQHKNRLRHLISARNHAHDAVEPSVEHNGKPFNTDEAGLHTAQAPPVPSTPRALIDEHGNPAPKRGAQ